MRVLNIATCTQVTVATDRITTPLHLLPVVELPLQRDPHQPHTEIRVRHAQKVAATLSTLGYRPITPDCLVLPVLLGSLPLQTPDYRALQALLDVLAATESVARHEGHVGQLGK